MAETEGMLLNDDDVRRQLPMEAAVTIIETAFMEMANGTLIAPPRFQVEASQAALVFTAGAAVGREPIIGFRVYGRFPEVGSDQIVAVYHAENGHLKGLVVGRLLGGTRTGAIGGVALKHLARPDARRLSVIGAGYQARTQVAAALAVRDFVSVKLYSRTASRAQSFAAEIETAYGLPTEVVATAKEAVAGADVVLCATNSATPVLNNAWLRPGTHVTTIGPKTVDKHELAADIADVAAVVATDSLAQAAGYDRPFFISLAQLVGLDQIVAGHIPGRQTADDITVFCSVGLAGTEVVLANALMNRVREGG